MLRRCSRNLPCKHHLNRRPVSASEVGGRPKQRTVDRSVNPIVDGVDFLAKFLGIDVDLGLVSGNEIVELGIEHPDDLGAFVVHNCLALLVPKHGNGEPVGLL